MAKRLKGGLKRCAVHNRTYDQSLGGCPLCLPRGLHPESRKDKNLRGVLIWLFSLLTLVGAYMALTREFKPVDRDANEPGATAAEASAGQPPGTAQPSVMTAEQEREASQRQAEMQAAQRLRDQQLNQIGQLGPPGGNKGPMSGNLEAADPTRYRAGGQRAARPPAPALPSTPDGPINRGTVTKDTRTEKFKASDFAAEIATVEAILSQRPSDARKAALVGALERLSDVLRDRSRHPRARTASNALYQLVVDIQNKITRPRNQWKAAEKLLKKYDLELD